MTFEPLLETLSTAKAHGGMQGVYRHLSNETKTVMTFAVFVPPHREGEKLPVLWYLSGLTCTHANCMEKGEYRRLAAVHGLILVLPDTSPRGENIPDEKDNWQFGLGAGFYLDATQAPYAENYRMYSYVLRELPEIVAMNFPADIRRQGIMGHSMGGHGALMMALKNPDKFLSASAFAPIVKPTLANWSRSAFAKYLGPDETLWREYDTCLLIEDGHRFPELLVDQGTADSFLSTGLMPELLEQTAEKAGQSLLLNMREGYDHSYHFISSFMDDHLRWHAMRLNQPPVDVGNYERL
jgi:S-formylglutathione hydrolase